MHTTPQDLKKDLSQSLDQMRTLRDEVRVRLHLAKMDVKDEWNKLEPHLIDVEKAAERFSEASYDAVVEAVKRLKRLRSQLG
jgi:hypothetical protein